MTREDYERRKLRLEGQLRAGIGLLESAYRAQVRALDLVWRLQAEEGGPVPGRPERSLPEPNPPSAPAPPKEEPLSVVNRPPAAERSGARPSATSRHRNALFQALEGLVQDGLACIESDGAGQRATVYRKNGV